MIRVIRPTWTPTNDEQRRLLAVAVRAAKKARDAMRKADEFESAAWDAIVAARPDVPDIVLCDQTGFSRATLNRKFGARNAVRWTGDNFDEVKAVCPDARLTPDGDLEVERVDKPGEYVIVGVNYVVHRREQN